MNNSKKWDRILLEAVRKKDVTLLVEAIEAGANVNAIRHNFSQTTALHETILYKFPEGAKILIDAGANVNAVNNLGHSPLDYLGTQKDNNMSEVTIKAGVSENGLDNNQKELGEMTVAINQSIRINTASEGSRNDNVQELPKSNTPQIKIRRY